MSLTDHQFHQRARAILALLDQVGEATMYDDGDIAAARVIEAETSAPLEPPLAQAYFKYTEVYARNPQRGWELTEYEYEFQQRPPPGRRAYHWHDGVHHAHCVDASAPGRDNHYRAVAVNVFEAHREFLGWYARNAPVNCIGLFAAQR